MPLDTEEGRAKLRKAAVSCKEAKNRRYPNGGTRLLEEQSSMTEYIGHERGTRGTETSKYPEEKKTRVIPGVAASETGEAQTVLRDGVVGPSQSVF